MRLSFINQASASHLSKQYKTFSKKFSKKNEKIVKDRVIDKN